MSDIEASFSNKIDCHLDYRSREQMLNLFEESKSISPKSIYRFLEELFNAPLYKHKSIALFKNIECVLNYIYKDFDHPLKKIIFVAGISKLNNTLLSTKKALVYLKEVSNFNGYYAALNIVESSSRRNNRDIIIDNLYDSIISHWERQYIL